MATKDKDKVKDRDQRGLVRNNGSQNVIPSWRSDIGPQMFEPWGRMFDQFFRGWPALGNGGNRRWRWGLEVQEKEAEIDIRAEVPGFEPDDFDVKVRGDQLILCACHKDENADNDRGYREWNEQEFYRIVPLPAEVDTSKVEAHYRNGVLDVKLPKVENGNAQKINVRG